MSDGGSPGAHGAGGGIEGGVECGRFVPLLSALADGSARRGAGAAAAAHEDPPVLPGSVEGVRRGARRWRRSYRPWRWWRPRAATRRGCLSVAGGAQQKAESALGAAQQKAAVLGERAHAAAELATGQKVAAVAPSAAALTGGGTAVDQLAGHQPPAARRRSSIRPRPPRPLRPAPPSVAPTQPARASVSPSGGGWGGGGGGGSTSGTEFALMRSAPEIEALGPRTRRAAVNETGRAIRSAWRRWHDRLRARGARRRRGTRDDVSRSPTLPATSPSPREAAGNQAAAIMHWTVFSRR